MLVTPLFLLLAAAPAFSAPITPNSGTLTTDEHGELDARGFGDLAEQIQAQSGPGGASALEVKGRGLGAIIESVLEHKTGGIVMATGVGQLAPWPSS
ncbi:hypothetical protein A1Q1_03705 [Trichosporon asahii var. asahii CBS 2479]|uniref:Uncharacterized protein n=1 Tax=Trichosporon asahii var. asahii (strain ATCC 90039 / CBS 2479 / JCM 2466 / KCTC 7840 / NBRC 103889/ NCYC 2677 / UAMH 7654) TaxID=1186058 RepID=J4U9U4_TRIAS|nr:hypothetical protein A1Q1_03705 [Trichosporon asahii var. asahii CBS 2479]EJT47450.1 hypothetical protein A1Q1_03705 [Trichosporon asahii var. asahii CBS 2479]